jgi:hypothetical protein
LTLPFVFMVRIFSKLRQWFALLAFRAGFGHIGIIT